MGRWVRLAVAMTIAASTHHQRGRQPRLRDVVRRRRAIGAGRDQVGDWLASTWGISTISTEFDAFHARRFGASINLDLRFTAP